MVNTINDFGLYVGTTILVELQQLIDQQRGEETSEEQRQLYVALYQAFNNIINALNAKDTGYYLTQEFLTSQVYFNVNNNFNLLRPVYRTVVNFGALPATGTKSVAHGISVTNTYSWVKISGYATDPSTVTGIPIPYASAASLTDQLEIYVDNTNVYITTGGNNYSGYTTTYVILEYIKE